MGRLPRTREAAERNNFARDVARRVSTDSAVRIRAQRILTASKSAASPQLGRLLAQIRDVIEAALLTLLSVDENRLAQIRCFHLGANASYSLAELADLWQMSLTDIETIFTDEIEAWEEAHAADSTSTEFRVPSTDAIVAAQRNFVWRAIQLEQALGAEFIDIRPALWETEPVVLYLPRFITTAVAAHGIAATAADVPAYLERLIVETLVEDPAAAPNALKVLAP